MIKSKFEFDVYVVDPNPNSLLLAESRATEINHEHSIFFIDTISDLPKELALVIVATSSVVRLGVIEKLLEHSKVSVLILEKVLFQSLDEYNEAHEFLRKTKTKTYVNHPRRMQVLYSGLRSILQEFNSEIFDVDFYGVNWGLGCNGLHFSDVVLYLLDDSMESYDNNQIDSEIIDSKRKGFIEFTGTISGKTTNGNRLRLTSRKTDSPFSSIVLLTINSPSLRISVFEGGVEPTIDVTLVQQDYKRRVQSFPAMLFQSDLSQMIVEDTLLGRNLQLTPYIDAMQNHKLFLASLLDLLNKHNDKYISKCPIT